MKLKLICLFLTTAAIFGIMQPSGANAITVRVEVDWLKAAGHNHRPNTCELDAVKAAFARNGHTLIYEMSTEITETPDLEVIDIGAPDYFNGGEWAALEAANRNHPPGTGWHYMIFGHNYSFNGSFTTSSGLGEILGDEFLVSLGSFSGMIGSPWDRAGTFMHELGHNLSLTHSGNQNEATVFQYKPNYASVMAYRYQLLGVKNGIECQLLGTPPSTFYNLDYSQGTLAGLDENALVEASGIGFGGVDWDCSGGIGGTVSHDISTDFNWCSSTGTKSVLTDYNDWANLSDVTGSPGIVAASPEVITCIGPDEFTGIAAAVCVQPDPCAEAPQSLRVPALTLYGLIALTLLLTGTAVWMFRRRIVV